MEIPFVGGAYTSRSPNLDAQQCINFYPVLDQEGGKSVSALYGTPGLKLFRNLNKAAPVRGLHVMDDKLYAVCGNTLYEIPKNAPLEAKSSTLDTLTGHVWMADNGTQLMIVDGSYGYIYQSGTLTKISDTDFPTPSSLTYQDGYFIVTKADSDEIYISALNDGTSWAALDFASAEGKPDDATAVLSDHRELWIFGDETTEVFYNSGDSDFPFERIQGAFIEAGIGAPASPAKGDNTVFWLDQYGRVLRAEGYTPRVVSTRQIEYQISRYSTISDAIGYVYTQEGHVFYVLTFPTANATWVYDITTGFWHERRSYQEGSYTDGRHRSNCYAFFDNKPIVGDYVNGKLYELDLDTYTDDGNTIKSIRAAQTIHNDRKFIFFHSLEIEFEAGVGLATGQGSDPQAILDWSDDGGHTWSNEHWRSMGKIGEYTKRAIWRRLGRSRNRIFRVTITDPVKRVIIGAHLEATTGRN